MICKKCGQETDGLSKFCSHCGEPLEAEENTFAAQPQQPEFNSNESNGDNSNNNKKGLAFAGIAVGAVAVVILLIVLVSNLFGSSKETPLDNLEKIANKQPTDVNKIVEYVAPDFISSAYIDLYKVLKGNKEYKDDIEDVYAALEDMLKDGYEELNDSAEDEFGKNVKYSYKITDKKKLEKDDLKDLAEVYSVVGDFKKELTEAIEIVCENTELSKGEVKKIVSIVEKLSDKFAKIKITEGYEFKVEVKVKGKDDEDTEKVKVAVIKANGDWTIDPILTAALQNKMDIGDVVDLYEKYGEDYVDDMKDEFDDVLDDLEDMMDTFDEDVIALFFEGFLEGLDSSNSIDDIFGGSGSGIDYDDFYDSDSWY